MSDLCVLAVQLTGQGKKRNIYFRSPFWILLCIEVISSLTGFSCVTFSFVKSSTDTFFPCSPNQTNFEYPVVNLTMKGGGPFFVNDPIVIVSSEPKVRANFYCYDF